MFEKFDDFLFEHEWARKVFIIIASLIGLAVDVMTFYVTFTCGDPVMIALIWAHRLMLIQYELGAGDTIFELIRFYKENW